MGLFEAFKKYFPNTKRNSNGAAAIDEIMISVPESVYIKELAVYTAVSLIANAISQSEILCYENNERKKNEDYYSLNIKPNKNESASQFWHKVVEKMFRNKDGALCFISGSGEIFCADNFVVKERRPFLGNIYDGVIVDDYPLSKEFRSWECFNFKLENDQARAMIDNAYSELSEVIKTALEAYKDTNATKYIFKVDHVQAGDEEFNEEFKNYLIDGIQQYVGGDKKVFVQYEGRELTTAKKEGQQKNSDDITKLIDQTFSVVGKAFKIPDSLMVGNINNMQEVVNSFLTFAIDPVADEISKTLTGAYGFAEWKNGKRFRVDTSNVLHVDIFAMGDKIDKVIACGVGSVDEVREKVGFDAIGEEWSKKHVLTKNYALAKDILKEGGIETDGKT